MLSLLPTLLTLCLTCLGAEYAPVPAFPGSGTSSVATPVNHPVNYVLHVDWKPNKGATNSVQLLTTEGTFRLDTSQPSAVNVGDSELPITVNVSGDLKALNAQQGRVQLFLGRSVPFLARGGGPPGAPSVQQRQEGLTLAFIVSFGKPVLIQKDANGEISVLVEREKP